MSLALTMPENLKPYAHRLADAYVVSCISFKQRDILLIQPNSPAQVIAQS